MKMKNAIIVMSLIGCSIDHIVNNQNYFCNHIELRNPIDVKLPDGKILKATKLGTVRIQ